jgi:hypothetical protein
MRNLVCTALFAIACSSGRSASPTRVKFELKGSKFSAQFPVEPRTPEQVFVQTALRHNASNTPDGLRWQGETFDNVEIGLGTLRATG